ncbi:hypothetical protein M0805_007843 [Coniferiporia weirii]|nr:hypothetical protein M0805_007843 [Coniferiporia weirii]
MSLPYADPYSTQWPNQPPPPIVQSGGTPRTASILSHELTFPLSCVAFQFFFKAGDPTVVQVPEELHGTRLEVKCIDMVFDRFSQQFLPRERASQEVNAVTVDPYAEYAFTLHRTIGPGSFSKAFFDIRSSHLRNVCADVIGKVEGISWTAKPLRVDHETFLVFLPELQARIRLLEAKGDKAEGESITHAHLAFFESFIRTEFASTLSEIEALLAQNEITFDLLWAIWKPRTVLYTKCQNTGEPRAVRLSDASMVDNNGSPYWQLNIEYTEYNSQHGRAAVNADRRDSAALLQIPKFGLVAGPNIPFINAFKGTVKIATLQTYPLKYHLNTDEMTDMLVSRGRKWASLQGGIHHMQYNKPCSWLDRQSGGLPKERVMVDRELFITARNVPYGSVLSQVTKTLSGEILKDVANTGALTPPTPDLLDPPAPEFNESDQELSNEDYLIANPCLYAFSFAEKHWLTISVSHVSPIRWNDEPFANLILSGNQKALVRALVETYYASKAVTDTRFDDFVQGKGQGLVINLFGNPGVGKTLTAEAVSEFVRKPLRVVGASELGTTSSTVENELSTIFRNAARWGAIVLIDEADVFLEERSLHDLQRNAMVAVFLRHLEYFRGILFLTTNRVRTFDNAFQSRIHVSLRYHDLGLDAKRKIWTAFLEKARGPAPLNQSTDSNTGLSEKELAQLSDRKINGRQIKNAVRTASALAISSGEALGYKHLEQVLEMMAEFESDLNTARYNAA